MFGKASTAAPATDGQRSRTPPFILLSDSTCQGVLQKDGKWRTWGVVPFGPTGWAIVCPGASLTSAYRPGGSLKAPGILAAWLAMGAGSEYSTESFLSSLGVPPPDKPVRVGLVRCDRSVPPEAQAKYDYVHKARQEYQLGPHEFNWTPLDHYGLGR